VLKEKNTRMDTDFNILFILVDDQSPFDFKFYNPASTLDAPNIERLAREGMVFDGAYHMGFELGAVCTPSRHMIMSGRTLWHLPIAPRGENPCPADCEQADDPRRLQPRRLRHHAHLQTGQQLRGGQQTLHRPPRCRPKRGGTDETGSAWHGEAGPRLPRRARSGRTPTRSSSTSASRTRTTRATARRSCSPSTAP
jgi:choline-sulfatase